MCANVCASGAEVVMVATATVCHEVRTQQSRPVCRGTIGR